MKGIQKNVGKRFRELRERQGFTREALAEALQTTPTSIYRIEKGQQWISPALLEKAAAIFQVDPALIFSEEPILVRPSLNDALAILAEAHGISLSEKARRSKKNLTKNAELKAVETKSIGSMLKVVEAFVSESVGKRKVPLMLSQVRAGSPAHADTEVDRYLELDEKLLKHPAQSFVVRVTGQSMEDAGIYSGDLLIVDRALEAQNNSIVIAAIDGELTVKRLKKIKRKILLLPENQDFKPIVVGKNKELVIWGVVTNIVRPLSR